MVSRDLEVVEQAVGLAEYSAYIDSRIDLIKRTIAKGATDEELEMFLGQCKRRRLDPFSNQIYAIKRWDAQENREVMAIQVSIDGLRLIADRTGCYVPGRPATFEYDAQGNLLSATAYVKKWARGEWHEVAETAEYEEYVGRTRKGEVTRMWREKPRVMLAKCAESRALHRAFPAETSALYTPEEMGGDDEAAARPPETPRIQVIDASTGEIAEAERHGPYTQAEIAKLSPSLLVPAARRHMAEYLELSAPSQNALKLALGANPKGMNSTQQAELARKILGIRSQAEAHEVIRAHKKSEEAKESAVFTESEESFAERVSATAGIGAAGPE